MVAQSKPSTQTIGFHYITRHEQLWQMTPADGRLMTLCWVEALIEGGTDLAVPRLEYCCPVPSTMVVQEIAHIGSEDRYTSPGPQIQNDRDWSRNVVILTWKMNE